MVVQLGTPGILPPPEPSMMGVPAEILEKIVWFCSAPINDRMPASLPSYSATKQLSLVNRRLREICVAKRLHHLRIQVLEDCLVVRSPGSPAKSHGFLAGCEVRFFLLFFSMAASVMARSVEVE